MKDHSIYSYNVALKADRYELLKGTVISSNEGIEIGMKPTGDYVERLDPETGNILWCNPEDYYSDSQGLTEFLDGEGIALNPFSEIT